MTNFELNARIAMKLYPGKTIHRNGAEIKCTNRVVDYRKPHLMERLLHEIGDTHITRMTDKTFDVNGYFAKTLAEAVALAYVNS